jgi:hypothetical protein
MNSNERVALQDPENRKNVRDRGFRPFRLFGDGAGSKASQAGTGQSYSQTNLYLFLYL